MRSIFISYRRTDAEGQAGRLYKDLCDRFGKEAVFIDVAGIAKGRDFRRALDEKLASCGVMLTIIGMDWLTAADENGQRRLDSPVDFIRLETAAALKRDIPVIPVLVRGARMPRSEELPDDLKELVFRDGVELTHARWDSDVQELTKALALYMEEKPDANLRLPSTSLRKKWRYIALLVFGFGFIVAMVTGYLGLSKREQKALEKAKVEAAAVERKRIEAEVSTAKAETDRLAQEKARSDAKTAAADAEKAEAQRLARERADAAQKAAAAQGATTAKPAVSGSDYSRELLSKETGDTLRILQISPVPGTRLTSGQTTQLKFRLRYNLQSRDKAVLGMSIVQTSPAASSCAAFNTSSNLQFIDSNEVVITRGERDIELNVTWHGGEAKGRTQARGFLAPNPSLWDVVGSSGRGSRVSILETVTEACWPFTP